MKCPRCGLFNPEAAQRCDCGWEFDRSTIGKEASSESRAFTSFVKTIAPGSVLALMYAAILLFHTLTIRAALLSYIFLGLGAGFAFSLERNVSTRKIYWTAVLAAVSAYLIIITASIITPQKGVELPFQDTELSSKGRGATNLFPLGLFAFASLVFGLVTVAGSLAAEQLQTTLRSFSSGADTADVHGEFTRLQVRATIIAALISAAASVLTAVLGNR